MNIDANGEKELQGKQIENHGASSGLKVQQQQQQSQGTGVCWERFLHVRTIRVLLVENDDSTRHVVTALLRNCNYDVLEAANGLQAWKVLEDLNNHVDIVLTEVVTPILSGVGLLCKTMSHKTRKNIPVIMMSSHDSMGVVFKCLSKGAVDFLVKPIRKNELKNLWQHVWRRCHSSSGSGSESGTQTQKSVKSKSIDKSGNHGSDDGENDASNGLNVGDGSDDGSGAQSSWTKQAVEVDSSQAFSPMDQATESPDSTCAQVIRPNIDNRKVQISAAREGHAQKQLDDVGKGNDMDTVVHGIKYKNHVEIQANRDSEAAREVPYKMDINNDDDGKEPNVELSLKRHRGVQDKRRSVQDDRYVLRRSEQSAFSRYNTSTNVFKAPPNGNTGSSSGLDNSTEVAKRESVGDMQVYSTDQIVYQNSNGVSNNNIDMGSTTNNLPKEKFEVKSGVHPSAFRHMKNDLRNSQQISLLPNGIQSSELFRGSYHNESNHGSDHGSDPGSNHGSNPGSDPGSNHGSNHGSDPGSNHGSNRQNGSSTAFNTLGNNAESDVGQAGKSGSGDASGSGSGNKMDENRLAQREAALIKFRQKRNERCFKKKVRYQNRKKLAEQRPRVRGQFVKQTGTESSGRTGDD